MVDIRSSLVYRKVDMARDDLCSAGSSTQHQLLLGRVPPCFPLSPLLPEEHQYAHVASLDRSKLLYKANFLIFEDAPCPYKYNNVWDDADAWVRSMLRAVGGCASSQSEQRKGGRCTIAHRQTHTHHLKHLCNKQFAPGKVDAYIPSDKNKHLISNCVTWTQWFWMFPSETFSFNL